MATCPWTIDVTCHETEWNALDPGIQSTATDWATGILDGLTGRQFAQCPVVLRPCGSRCGWSGGYLTFPVTGAGPGSAWMTPYVGTGGVWRNCSCATACTCRATCEAYLPGPVAEIVEVRTDGVVLDPAAYRLDATAWGPALVRTDGSCWPECQDMSRADTEPGTWSVQYRPGQPLPPAGAIAAGELAMEFARGCAGSSSCTLPQQLVAMSRNGVDVQVVDPTTVLENGLTGIANVDTWIRSVNPARLPSRPRVLSPDLPRQRVTHP